MPRSAVLGMRMPSSWLHRSYDSLARSVSLRARFFVSHFLQHVLNRNQFYVVFPKDEFIVGPLLCIIYINDLPNASNLLKTFLYDTSLFYSLKDPNQLICVMNCELSKISEWLGKQN